MNDTTKEPAQTQPRRVLSLFDAVCVIVGTIIGSGIFATAPVIASNANSFWILVGLWMLGGFVSLVGALCFAELMTTNPNRVGGDYVYLKTAYGRPMAFMFAWAAFWIIRPGNIGAMAMIFAQYFEQITREYNNLFGLNTQIVFAIGAVIVLSLANLIGLKAGKRVQNILTSAKVLGILAIVVLAALKPAESIDLKMSSSENDSLWLAMILVMFTYGGWNDIAFVTGEIRDPKRNLFRSLVLGTMVVTIVYVLVNIAFVVGLGFERMANSSAVATDLTTHALGSETSLGQRSGQLIAALVCISCLGAINGMILTSPRIYYALGKDVRPLRSLAGWSEQRDVPWQSVILQSLVTIGLISICLGYKDAFEVIVVTTAPYFWGFLGLTVFSLIVLRLKGSKPQAGEAEQGVFRVPLYPLTPIFFGCVCLGLLYNSITYLIFKQYTVAFGIVTGLMVIGIGLAFFLTHPRFQTDDSAESRYRD